MPSRRITDSEEINMPTLNDLIDGDAQRLDTGFTFTEGPLYHPNGFYYFVDVRESKFYRIKPGEKAELLRENTGEGNGTTFDLPVLRYRAMVHRISGAGLTARNYFARETDAATDLCETLASFDQRAKVKLDLLCKTLGFTGKPGGIDGSQVDSYVADGRIAEVAAYCETDVVNTYRVWLTYELFEGRLSREAWVASEDNLRDFIFAQLPDKPHLRALVCGAVEPAPGVLDDAPAIAASQPAKALASTAVPGSTITWRMLLNIVRDYSFRAWQRL